MRLALSVCLLAAVAPVRAQTISIFPGGVVDAASYTAPVAAGSIATAFGSFPVAAPASASGGAPLSSLGGLSLKFGNGELAPLFYVSSGQISFQVPWDLAGQTQTTLTASVGSQSSAPQAVSLAPFAPGIFSQNSEGSGQGAILNAAYQLVDSANPATAGTSIIQIYCTGLGAVSNTPATGSPALSQPLSMTPANPTVTIGGAAAAVLFSGLAPTLVGLYQINAVVPAGSSTGSAVPVVISMGGVSSNTVTMAVNSNVPNPTPQITSLAPFSAATGANSLTLTIQGSGFGPSSTVTVNGISQPVTYTSSSQLSVALNAADLAAAGSFPVVVTNPSPGGGTSNTVNFVVQAGFGSGVSSSIAWSGYARDAQHSALSINGSQPLGRIRWSTPVDDAPQLTGNELLIHYGSPLVTAQNTVIVPVKTGAAGGFSIQARAAADGSLLWSQASDYVLPAALSNWVPEFAPVLTPASRLYYAGAGGTVHYRDSPDSASGPSGQLAFYGLSTYQANSQSYNANVMINTPITSDAAGNIYFGFLTVGSTPAGLQSGIARIDANGQGTWISAASAAADSSIVEVVWNCAPALSANQGTLYIAVSNGSAGYLLALNSTTLVTTAKVRLIDPLSGFAATLSDNGTASPTVGPDGDVYYGVLEYPAGENHYRGWMLHFNSTLSQSKTFGAFGWDDTPSLVPSFLVSSYTGTSPYLLMTKYNDYAEAGGTGLNRIAILDPNATEIDSVTGAKVMLEALTILGQTPNSGAPGVTEWCINSAAVDPSTGSVLAGNEDGKLYRWNLRTNTFSESLVLTPGIGEAYTPTLIGPDGTVYAINDATLFAIGQ